MKYQIRILSGLLFLIAHYSQGQNLLEDITFGRTYYPWDIGFSQNCEDKQRHEWQKNSHVEFGWDKGGPDSFQTYYFKFNAQQTDLSILQLKIERQNSKTDDNLVLRFSLESLKATNRSILKFAWVDKPISLTDKITLKQITPFYQINLENTQNNAPLELPIKLRTKTDMLLVWLEGTEKDTFFTTIHNLCLHKKGGNCIPTPEQMTEVSTVKPNIDYVSWKFPMNKPQLDSLKEINFINQFTAEDYKRIYVHGCGDTLENSSSQHTLALQRADYIAFLLAKKYPNVSIEVVNREDGFLDKEDKSYKLGLVEIILIRDF